MSYNIDCFKSYEIKNMMDFSGEYEFIMIDKCDGEYISPSMLSEINDYLNKHNLQILHTLVPSFGDGDYFDGITKIEAENIAKKFVQPSKCIDYIENNKIIEKIEKNKPDNYEDMIFTLQNLINKWKDGYYVYKWY